MGGAMSDMNLAVSNEQMKTFATETGGRAFFPRFQGEMSGIFRMVHESLRNNYTLTYQPSNQTKDGKFRRLKVELVNSDNQPMKVVDEKEQADQGADHHQGRLQSTARSGIGEVKN